MIFIFLLANFLLLNTGHVYGEEEKYEKLEIKHGMYERTVNERYGEPAMVEKIKGDFWPIPRSKALYKIGEFDYMILHFFSRRVRKITILSDVGFEEAVAIFKQDDK